VATDGRCTLTTTRSPVRSVAACTWAMEAAASGSWSMCANTSSTGRRSSSSMTWRTAHHGSGGTWSRQRWHSSTSSAGNRPWPDEMIWASLM
jgi:hypothetical protein